MSSPTLDLAAEKNEKNKEKMKKVLLLPTATLMPMPAMDPQSEQTAQIMNIQALAIQRHSIQGLLTLLRLFGKVVRFSVFLKKGKHFCAEATGLCPVGTNCPLKRTNPWVYNAALVVSKSRVARWFLFKPNIPFGVTFGGP
jgi:hypothetical protein